MAKRNKKTLRLFVVAVALFFSVLAVGGTITYSKYYEGENSKADKISVATPVSKIVVNEITRREKNKPQSEKLTVPFNQSAESIILNDIEPEDEIEYYFTVSGIDGAAVNQVTMNVTISIEVRLETIPLQEVGAESGGTVGAFNNHNIDYFGGWTIYGENDGVKNGGYLKIYHGSKTETPSDILQSATADTSVDFSGKRLAIVEENGVLLNKVGLVMRADDVKKDYSYHLIFNLPKQSADKDSYASAKLYINIKTLAEQVVQA